MSNKREFFNIRLCLLGSSGVGKTSLCSQFVSHYFPPDHIKTTALTIFRTLTLINNTPVMLEIDDLFPINHSSLSEDSFNNQTFQRILENKSPKPSLNVSIYSEKAIDGLIFLFDLTDPSSLDLIETVMKQVMNKETERLGQQHPNLTKKILIGTKVDLGKQRVKQTEISRLELAFSLRCFKLSTKDVPSVNKVFKHFTSLIFQEKFANVSFSQSTDSEPDQNPAPQFFSWCDCSKRSKSRATCSIS